MKKYISIGKIGIGSINSDQKLTLKGKIHRFMLKSTYLFFLFIAFNVSAQSEKTDLWKQIYGKYIIPSSHIE